QRRVAQNNAAAERVSQQLSAELPNKVIFARTKQMLAQAFDAFKFGTACHFGRCVDGISGCVKFPTAANCVIVFQCESEGIDADVAAGTGGIGAMSLGEISLT